MAWLERMMGCYSKVKIKPFEKWCNKEHDALGFYAHKICMHPGFLILLSCLCVFGYVSIASAHGHESEDVIGYLVAENAGDSINAYDPFIDYSEFENTIEEQESINFFQHGRFLSLGLMGGVQLFTLNLINIYRPGPFYGGYLNYFFDLHFAVQFTLMGSFHEASWTAVGGTPFIGQVRIFSLGADFKYFLDRNLFSRSIDWLRPFLFVGVFRSYLSLSATRTGQTGIVNDNGFGFNAGLGTEFHFTRKFFFGIQYAFHYVTLSKENVPLSNEVAGGGNFTPYGDWMSISALFGVNF